MARRIFCLLILLFTAGVSQADERVRQVQEELRRRNLYFGDVDGQQTPELANALRRYQARKGFSVTGTIDDATATSLDVQPTNATFANASTPPLPDVPVLRSDSARQLSQQQKLAIERQAEANLDATQTPAPPAEAPTPGNNFSPERVQEYVEQYLRDSEAPDIPAQTKYFNYPVEYFDHGTVNSEFVQNDVANYVKRWPDRHYTLLEQPKIVATSNDTEARVEFPISFDVRNSKHEAKGRTDNFWTLRQDGDQLKIVAIREQRLR